MKKKKEIFLLFLVLSSTLIFSAPYNGNIFEFLQPDGRKVKIKLYGNECYIRAESLDGYTLIRDTQTGWICYAELSEDGNLVSSGIPYDDSKAFEEAFESYKDKPEVYKKKNKIGRKLDISKDKIEKIIKDRKKKLGLPYPAEDSTTIDIQNQPAPPTRRAVGNIKGLAIIVDFSDYPATLPLTEYISFFNDLNYSNFNNNGSIKKYFLDVSGGLLEYDNIVYGIFRAPKTFAEYDNMSYGAGAQEILRLALQWIDQQGFDFSTLSTDSNKRILAINLMYTGYPKTWAQGMWYHAGWYGNFSADGVRSGSYACMPANSPLSIGTACHENGHMVCGWPDTYKYSSDTGPDGIGAFDLMCGGAFDKNPVPPNPYFIYTVGWGSLIDVNDWGNRIIFDVANDNIFYRYRNLSRTQTNHQEFYILATMQKTGRHANIPDEGLTIWHIDEDGDNQTTHHLVFLEHANNDITNHSRACFRSDRGYTKFNDYTTPSAKWYDNNLSFFNCYEISNPGSTMRYRIGDLNKEWYFITGQEGWSFTNNVSGSVSNGILTLNITGSDPYIHSPDNLNLSSADYKYIRIRIKNVTSGNTLQVYWITTTDTVWNETKHTDLNVIPNNNEFKEYVVDLSKVSSWSGTIKQIRIDPPGNNGTVEIDYIKLDKGYGVISGKVYAISSKHSGKYLTVANNSSEGGANIQQNSFSGIEGQFWLVEDVGDNYYKFTSLKSNLVFDIKDVSTENGAELIQWNWWAGDGQKFKMDYMDNTYCRLSPKHSGKSLDVSNLSTSEDAKIIQWDWHGGDNQLWKFIKANNVSITINPPNSGSVEKNLNYFRYLNGTNLSLTAVPNEGYRFVGWAGDVNYLTPSINLLINDDLNIIANFTLTTHTVVLTVFPESSGSISLEPIQEFYIYGTTMTLTAIPSDGYWFSGWNGDIESFENPINIVVKNNLNITANFRLSTHTITVVSSPTEASQLEIKPKKEYYTYGEEVNISFTKNNGWDFLGWSGLVEGFDNPLNFIVKTSGEIIANFKLTTHTVLVEIEPQNAGYIIKHPEEDIYTFGTLLNLEAVPNEGFWFDSWSGDLNSKNNPLNISIERNLNLKANFVPSLHTVNTNIYPYINCGSITKNPQQIYYVYGSTVTLTVAPAEGWEFVGWSVDSDSITFTKNPLELTVKKNLNINAHFKLTTHTITTFILPTSDAGNIVVNPKLTYYLYGTNVKLEAKASTGWEFLKWNGELPENVDVNSPVIEFLIKKDITLYANFKRSTYTITIEIIPSLAGKILKVPNSDFYYYGTTVTLTAVADKKFKFDSWNGDYTSSEKTITLQVVDNVKLFANFIRQKDYFLSLNPTEILNKEIYFGPDVEKIEVYNTKGKLVYTINGNKWDGKIEDRIISIGFYILKIKTSNQEKYEKLIILK